MRKGYQMRIIPNNRGFNIVGERGELIVGQLATEAAAIDWIKDNAGDWPPNWRQWKKD
jgi:hypothetical protein